MRLHIYIYNYIYTHVYNIYIYYGDISYIPYIFGDIPSITPGTMGPSVVLPFFGSVGSAQVELDELHSKYQELHDATQAKTDGGREILLFVKGQRMPCLPAMTGNAKFIPPIYLW